MKKIDMQTTIRTVLLVVALVNQALVMFGKNTLPFTDDEITQFLTLGFTLVTAGWSYWKNNNWTKEAKVAQGYLNDLKSNTPAPSVEPSKEPYQPAEEDEKVMG